LSRLNYEGYGQGGERRICIDGGTHGLTFNQLIFSSQAASLYNAMPAMCTKVISAYKNYSSNLRKPMAVSVMAMPIIVGV